MLRSLPTICLPLLLLIISSFGAGESKDAPFNPARMYTVEELREDFLTLRHDIEKRQPNLYAYSSEARMNAVFDSMYNAIDHPMNWYAFYAHVTTINSFIKDGHNFIGPGEKTSAYADKFQKYIPLHLYAVNGRLYSDMNCSRDTSVFDGSEILFLNGVPANEVQNDFMKHMLRDGYNLQFPKWIFNTYFRGFHGFLHGFPESYTVVCTTREGLTQTVTMPGLLLDSIVKIRAEKYPERTRATAEKKGMQLLFLPDSVAVITIHSFDGATLKKTTHQHYRKEIARYFDRIDSAKCTRLVLDLRDNNGGNVVNARMLAQQIMTQRFEYSTQTLKTRRLNPGGRASRVNKCRMPGFCKGDFDPVKHPFTGKVVVITNGGSFSATSEFCSVVKRYNRVLFVGEETGGNRYLGGGNMFGNKVELPNTGIVCNSGTEATVLGDLKDNNGRGILPDYEVYNSVDDVVKGRDAVMEKALEIVTQR